MRPVIIVFAKAPTPGFVKTRLVPPLTPAQAAALHDALVRDTLAGLRAFSDTCDVELHTDIVTDAWNDLTVARAVQCEGNLGLKILEALDAALSVGRPRALILGSDSPSLPPAHIQALLESSADVAIGPAEDGGYYGIAASRTHPSMFDGVPWSASSTLVRTIDACSSAGLTTTIGPAWFDIDQPADLERLLRTAEEGSCAARLLSNFCVKSAQESSFSK